MGTFALDVAGLKRSLHDGADADSGPLIKVLGKSKRCARVKEQETLRAARSTVNSGGGHLSCG